MKSRNENKRNTYRTGEFQTSQVYTNLLKVLNKIGISLIILNPFELVPV